MPGAMKYEARPVVVDAYRWDGTSAEMYMVVGWILANGGTAWIQSGELSQESDVIRVETKNSIVVLYPEGWAVKEASGEFTALTDDDFALKYDVPGLPSDK